MSLKWTGLEDVIIKEEPAGEHFAEFQLGLEGLPNNFSIDAIKALTDMAKPVQAYKALQFARLLPKLLRNWLLVRRSGARLLMYLMYTARLRSSPPSKILVSECLEGSLLYDRRHLVLDQNQYGDFLSDYSGIRDASTLQISFGRETKFGINATLPNQHLHYKLRDRISTLYNSNVFVLDSGILDEDFTELFDPGFVHEHSFIFEMPDGIALAEIPQTCVSQAKSQLILSDDDPLGSENTALGSFFVQETGQTFVLGEDALSDHLWEQTKTEVLERFTDEFFAEAAHPQTYGTAKWSASAHFLYAANPSVSATFLRQTYCAPFTAAYTGAIFWHDHRHLDRPWSEEEAIA
jgi:hypothetical protein